MILTYDEYDPQHRQALDELMKQQVAWHNGLGGAAHDDADDTLEAAEYVQEILGRNQHDAFSIYLWSENGHIAGAATVAQYDAGADEHDFLEKPSDSTAILEELVVSSSERGTGIGTRFFDALCETMKSEGVKQVWLACYTQNSSALRFYEKCGMESVRTVFEKKL